MLRHHNYNVMTSATTLPGHSKFRIATQDINVVTPDSNHDIASPMSRHQPRHQRLGQNFLGFSKFVIFASFLGPNVLGL